MNSKSKFSQHPLAAWSQVGDEVFVVSPVDNTLHRLNETASFVWLKTTGESPIDQVAQMLASEYEIDEQTALADVEEVMSELSKKGLIVFSDEQK